MEKLLHERLRNYTKQCFSINRIHEIEGTIHLGDLLDKWADEIERYYIPRPRFEDGEPVQFGDEVFSPARKIINKPDEQYIVEGMRFYDGFVRFDNDKSQTMNFIAVSDGKFVKRPAHKVLDADGVEIKVGDTVYRESDGEKLTVKQLFTDSYCGECFTSKEWGVGQIAKHFTHERPVFDAEGEKICKGDTVWHVGDASRGTVVGVIMDNTWHGYPVKVAWDKGDEGFYPGDALTHREPDSLEKLRDDMVMTHDAADEPCSTTEEWIDRLTALMERGA